MKAVAIVLAGGVGSRLNVLVRHRAKPAVPFGGVYRIIDFTLSNVANSGVERVAVLTQYKPLSLMDHIADGSSWDLSGRTRGIRILPPKTGEKDWDWYHGTADAVRQNLSFVTGSESDYVLVLSGDHVYYMDYQPMIRFHRERGARVTVGMLPVPWEETSQFGTAVVDGDQRIVEWEEKSSKAKSNLASMGIYVFDRTYLIDLLSKTREEDFGHHIIPMALEEKVVFAYPFDGYWRDVGTVQAYWDANMDLLEPASGLDPEAWKVMTNLNAEGIAYDRPPTRITQGAAVRHSIISPGCLISGTVEDSILSPGVIVEPGASIRGSVLMHDAVVRKGAILEKCIVDKEAVIGRDALLGHNRAAAVNRQFPEHLYSGLSVVGKRAVIPDGAVIGANCVIYSSAGPDDFVSLTISDGEVVGGDAQ